jgi:hypothetical protein
LVRPCENRLALLQLYGRMRIFVVDSVAMVNSVHRTNDTMMMSCEIKGGRIAVARFDWKLDSRLHNSSCFVSPPFLNCDLVFIGARRSLSSVHVPRSLASHASGKRGRHAPPKTQHILSIRSPPSLATTNTCHLLKLPQMVQKKSITRVACIGAGYVGPPRTTK